MLEGGIHQASGLQDMSTQGTPRLMAMASHGCQQGEHPLLWSLCATLVDLGYPVAVLDASTAESERNPGLLQWLDSPGRPRQGAGAAESWSVLPASLGLQALCQQGSPVTGAWTPLAEIFQNYGVVVVYASADVLSSLLARSGIEPLLTVSPLRTSPLTAYQALKQMLLTAHLRPTIASIVNELPLTGRVGVQGSPAKKLQECAMNFLGYPLDSWIVRATQSHDRLSDDMRRLALRLLEKAMPLYRHHFVGNR